jgi:hypothetical protein
MIAFAIYFIIPASVEFDRCSAVWKQGGHFVMAIAAPAARCKAVMLIILFATSLILVKGQEGATLSVSSAAGAGYGLLCIDRNVYVRIHAISL